MRKFATALTAVSMAALLLSGCGGETAPQESAAAESAAETETEEVKVYPEEAYLENLNVDDYVELGDYLGVEVAVTKTEITDEHVQSYIDSVLASNPEKKEVTGRAVESGDIADINYEGKKDGVAFDGGTAENYELGIGTGTFIDGFEDGVIGMEVGETKDLNLTFPENYGNADLAGAEVVFTVTVNKIYEEVAAEELTDAFVANLGIAEVATAEDYRNYVKNGLTESAQAQYDMEVENAVLAAVTANATFKKDAEAMAERYYDRLITNLTYQASMYGLDLDTYVYYSTGMEKDAYEAEMKASAQEAVKQVLVLQAVAEQEGMTVTEADVEEEIAKRAEEYGYESAEEYKEALGTDIKGFAESVMMERMAAYLMENASVVDAPAEAETVEEDATVADETSTEETSAEEATETAETETETEVETETETETEAE